MGRYPRQRRPWLGGPIMEQNWCRFKSGLPFAQAARDKSLLPINKYMDGAAAAIYSRGASDYPEICAAAIAEMHRQVGDLVVDEDGIALRGLMIRHLVLPDNKSGTDLFLRWVVHTLGPGTYVNIMPQYHPAQRSGFHPEINGRITADEYARARQWAFEAGLINLDPG